MAAHEPEESLGTGLERQMAAVDGLQQQLANFGSDISRLKVQCDGLKEERAGLLDEISLRGSERVSLSREIEHLTAQRDSLQIEYAALCEDEQYLRQADALATTELEATGRMARALWLSGEQVRKLKEQLAGIERVHESAIEEERHVAAGLRRRIQRLEKRLHEQSPESIQVSTEAEHEMAVLKDENQRLARENKDARDALSKETRDNTVAIRRIEDLGEELRLAQEDAAHYKAVAVTLGEAVTERDTLRAENAALKEAARVNTSVLQAISPNVATPPRTPPKTTLSQGGVSPSAPLAKQFAHLEQQHARLKATYDSLRTKYQNDLRHWKDFRAHYLARKEARQKRHDERQAARSTGQGSSRPSSPVGALDSEGTGMETRMESEEVSPPRKRPRSEVTEQPRAKTAPELVRAVTEVQRPVRPVQSAVETGTGGASTRRNTGTWHDTSVKKDPFNQDLESDITTPARPHRSLVRDRTGTLLRSALVKTTGAVDATTPTSTTPDSRRPLNFEAMSPAERAAEKKRISLLPVEERRKLYAPYKGHGRYMKQEDIKPRVADEYEVDPDRNDGANYQYHNVVRGRDERRKMHGGDCECCREYYQAVGHVPRLNQAPAWSDQDVSAKDSSTGIEDHQNRISRHRETWRKPPTPPDYWKIGFPSTQDVAELNARADEMEIAREAEKRREAERADSKYRKRT